MRERIENVCREVNADILAYDGTMMLEEGIIDSFDIINLVSELEEEFDVEIDARYVVKENFANIDAIAALMESLLRK